MLFLPRLGLLEWESILSLSRFHLADLFFLFSNDISKVNLQDLFGPPVSAEYGVEGSLTSGQSSNNIQSLLLCHYLALVPPVIQALGLLLLKSSFACFDDNGRRLTPLD